MGGVTWVGRGNGKADSVYGWWDWCQGGGELGRGGGSGVMKGGRCILRMLGKR